MNRGKTYIQLSFFFISTIFMLVDMLLDIGTLSHLGLSRETSNNIQYIGDKIKHYRLAVAEDQRRQQSMPVYHVGHQRCSSRSLATGCAIIDALLNPPIPYLFILLDQTGIFTKTNCRLYMEL